MSDKNPIAPGSKRYQLLQEYFRYCRDHFEPGGEKSEVEFVKSLLDDGNALCEKYRDDGLSYFASYLVMAHLKDLEARKRWPKKLAVECEIIIRPKIKKGVKK